MHRPSHWLRQPAHPATRRTTSLRVEPLEDRVVPDGRPLPLPVIYVGSGEGVPPVVKAYDAETGALNFERPVFDPEFTGGVRVAVADFSGDGFPDVAAAAGPGGEPHVKVLDGKTGDPIPGPLGSFLAYDPAFAGGVEVAAADVDGDAVPDLVTGAGIGGAAHVQTFSGRDGALMGSFLTFDLGFRGGVSVAAADFTGDGKAEVAVGAGPGGGPHVRVLGALTGEPVPGPLGNFFAFDPATPGGVRVGADWKAGDFDADGTPDLAVGAGPGAANRVRVFSGASGEVLADFAPFDPAFAGGVGVAFAYVDDDPHADLVAGTGPGAPAAVRVFSGATGQLLPPPQGEYAPFGPDYAGGVSVAASNDPVYLSMSLTVTDAVEPATNGGPPVAVGKFRINVSGAVTTAFQVYYTLTGTAGSGSDYNAVGTITINPGVTYYDVSVTPRWDGVAEGSETVVFTLLQDTTPPFEYERQNPTSATLLVKDTATSPPPPPPPATGSIGDRAWYDANGNGAQDAGEANAPGVAVTLSLGGSTVASATTDASGNYLFTGLAAGTYTVSFAKSGYSFSTPAGGTKTVVLASNGTVRDADAGLVANGLVGDRVWEDLNRNGLQDWGEPGIPGAAVDLYPLPSGSPRSATTDANGAYYFYGVPPGQYVARVQLPAGFQFTAPWVSTGGAAPAAGLTPSGLDSEADPIYAWTNPFTVAQGQSEQGVDVGAYRPPAGTGTAYGTVWDDANGDGLQTGEAGLGGVRVDIYDAAGTTYLGWAMTGPRGGYTFPGLSPGTYTLRVQPPYLLSPRDQGGNDAIDSDFFPETNAVTITVTAGQAVFRDAGFRRWPAAGAVGDRVWDDLDRDGVQDTGEPGLSGVLVRLRDESFQQVGEVLTDAAGWYTFPAAGRSGLYQLVFIPPATHRLTEAGAGSDRAADSDADPITSCTDWFTFPTEFDRLDLDAGAAPTGGTATIAGTVWDDRYTTYGLRTTDGASYEPGLAGVTVELLYPPGNPVLDAAGQPVTAKTGPGGGYVFSGLPGGSSYRVRVQAEWPLSPMDYGADGYDGIDSDFDPTNYTTLAVSTIGGGVKTRDAGVKTGPVVFVSGDFTAVEAPKGQARDTVKLIFNRTSPTGFRPELTVKYKFNWRVWSSDPRAKAASATDLRYYAGGTPIPNTFEGVITIPVNRDASDPVLLEAVADPGAEGREELEVEVVPNPGQDYRPGSGSAPGANTVRVNATWGPIAQLRIFDDTTLFGWWNGDVQSSQLMDRVLDPQGIGTNTPDKRGPNLNDIAQGGLGNCYLLSAIGALIKKNPELIRSKIEVDQANGTVSMWFAETAGGPTVKITLPMTVDAGSDQSFLSSDTDDNGAEEIWVQMVEKLYAEFLRTRMQPPKDDIDGTSHTAREAWIHLTGEDSKEMWFTTPLTSASAVAGALDSALQGGVPTVIGTHSGVNQTPKLVGQRI